MKCVDCQNQGMCLDHKEQPSLIGCTSGIPQRKKQTNADRIRSMSDEELADFLSENTNCDCCNIQCPDKLNCQSMSSCYCRHLEWLQSEVEE